MHWISGIGLGFICITLLGIIPWWVAAEKRRRFRQKQAYAQKKGVEIHELMPNRSKVSRTIRKRVLHRDEYRCQKCGSSKNLTIDHILPRAEGGGNEMKNLQILCQQCNWAKGSSF